MVVNNTFSSYFQHQLTGSYFLGVSLALFLVVVTEVWEGKSTENFVRCFGPAPLTNTENCILPRPRGDTLPQRRGAFALGRTHTANERTFESFLQHVPAMH